MAVTYDKTSGLARIYVRGTLREELHLGAFTPATKGRLFLGGEPGSNSALGDLDELTFYDRALTPPEVGALANATTAKCAPSANLAPMVEAGASIDVATITDTIVLDGAGRR